MSHLPPAARIAVVEDNPELLADLVEFLGLRGFAARGFGDAEAFFQAWPATRFDLLLLDVALPGLSGLEIAQRVGALPTERPGVVMLTALDANEEQVQGWKAGADAYLSKRSSLEVIEAACHGVLRRLKPSASLPAPAPPEAGAGEGWRLRARHWQLLAPTGAALALTQAEVALLAALCEKPGQAVTRVALLACLGKAETLSSLRNLDNTASRLRRKVQAACGLDLPLRPSYGRGYTFTGNCEVEP